MFLDYHTVAGVDKFGNFNVSRLSEDVVDNVDDDPTGATALLERGHLNGCAQKVESLATYGGFDLNRAPYVLYGVKYIDLVSLTAPPRTAALSPQYFAHTPKAVTYHEPTEM